MKYTGNDFYCDVALKGKEPIEKEYESDQVLAYKHTRPHWETHYVVVAKKHIDSFSTLKAADAPILSEMLEVARKIARKLEKEEGGARILTNLGEYQDSKHLHFHVTAGEEIEGLSLEDLEDLEPDTESEDQKDPNDPSKVSTARTVSYTILGITFGAAIGAAGASQLVQPSIAPAVACMATTTVQALTPIKATPAVSKPAVTTPKSRATTTPAATSSAGAIATTSAATSSSATGI
ncbi:MAG: HIT domain-containing protein [Candidatus Kaiserbacteria bacterium]|nr:HIT domain-containing protein [Candidatus Kaiserbacteria bacterium]